MPHPMATGRGVPELTAIGCREPVDRVSTPHRDDVPFVQGDVTDLDTVRGAVSGYNAIIHLAAIDLGVPATPERYFGVNVMGTWNVLQAAQEAGIAKVVLDQHLRQRHGER